MKNIITFSALISLLALNGCASYDKKFKDKKVANIANFSDSTISMLSDLSLKMNREDTLLVRRFFDESDPEEQRVKAIHDSLQGVMDYIIRYSIELANIAEAETDELGRVQLYADYVALFKDRVVTNQKIDEESFDDTIQLIREQETFIEALQAAQVVMNVAAVSAALDIEDLIKSIDSLSRAIDRRIDTEYADIIRYRTKLESEKFAIVTAFELLYDAYRDEQPDLSKLPTAA